MKIRARWLWLTTALALTLLVLAGNVAANVVTREFQPKFTWSRDGDPLPSVKWSPWLPQPHAFLKYRFGFRFTSEPTLDIASPMKVLLRYDPDDVAPGKRAHIEVLLRMLECEGDVEDPDAEHTFESHFGLELPNQMKVGLGGGLGPVTWDFKWFDCPVNMWDLFGFVPVAGDILAAGNQFNVSMMKNEAMPMSGKDRIYDDPDGLCEIEIPLGDLVSTARRKAIVNKIYNKLEDMDALETVLEVLSEKAIKKLVRKGLDDFVDSVGKLTLALSGSYRVHCNGIRLWLTSELWGGEDEYALYFAPDGPTEKVNGDTYWVDSVDVYIPSFTAGADSVKWRLSRVEYGMEVFQQLQPEVGCFITNFPFNIDVQKMAMETLATDFGEDEYQVEVNLAEAPDIFDYYEHIGATSTTITWLTPNFKTKGTVVLNGGNQTHEKAENQWLHSHGLVFTGLDPETTYTYTVTSKDEGGGTLISPSRSFTTLSVDEVSTRSTGFAGNVLTIGGSQISNVTSDSATLTWTTNIPASSEVLVGKTPEYGSSGVWGVNIKEPNGNVKTYFPKVVGERTQRTQHEMTLQRLDPGTTYYYSIVSWAIDHDSGDGTTTSYIAEIANLQFTTDDYIPPFVKVRVREQTGLSTAESVPGAEVAVLSEGKVIGTYPADENGEVNVWVKRGEDYSFTARKPGYAAAAKSVSIGENEEGSPATLDSVQSECVRLVPVFVEKLPSQPGVVLDAWGDQSISGVTVTPENFDHDAIETNSGGEFIYTGLDPGTYEVKLSKDGYLQRDVTFRVTPQGRFVAGVIRMVPDLARLKIKVKDDEGDSVPATVKVKSGTTVHGTHAFSNGGSWTFEKAFNGPVDLRVVATPNGNAANTHWPSEETVHLANGERGLCTVTCTAKDTTAPLVTGAEAEQLSPVSWRINWNTNEDACCTAEIYKAGDQEPLLTYSTDYGSEHEYEFDLAEVEGLPLRPAVLQYKYRIKAADVPNNVTHTEPEDLPRDNVPPRLMDLLADRLGVLRWRLSWATNEMCYATLRVFRQDQGEEPFLTKSLDLKSDHQFQLDLESVSGLPSNRAGLAYKVEVVAEDEAGNTKSDLIDLPRDDEAPTLGDIKLRRTDIHEWQLTARANEPVRFTAELLLESARKKVVIAKDNSRDLSKSARLTLVPRGEEATRACSLRDTFYRLSATDESLNTTTEREKKIDRGKRPRPLLGKLPRVLPAGEKFEFRCVEEVLETRRKLLERLDKNVPRDFGDHIVQEWSWYFGDGKEPRKTHKFKGFRAEMDNQFDEGDYRLVVYMLDTENGLAAEAEHAFVVKEPLSLKVRISPPLDKYKPGQKIKVIIEVPENARALRSLDLNVGGRLLKRLSGRKLRPLQEAGKMAVPYKIPLDFRGELDFAPVLTGESGVSSGEPVKIRVGKQKPLFLKPR